MNAMIGFGVFVLFLVTAWSVAHDMDVMSELRKWLGMK